ncbi:MAG: hypothetical protein HYX56_01565 [Chloroflexi bacterium]|nr:hypothetical protein [Chloroflexota bacterium]
MRRVKGNATTDFGAPGAVPPDDEKPMRDADLRRYRAMLRAYWRAFDEAVESARGKKLAPGPRGGGRSLERIVDHVVEAERGYLSALGAKAPPSNASIEEVRDAVIEGMGSSARGEIPALGPRGGKRWKPRFFARRLGWHALDHAWEIGDRAS